jgi:hypothetical protein
MIVLQVADLRACIAKHQPRNATIELAIEQLRRDAVELRIDRDACRREATTKLGAPLPV